MTISRTASTAVVLALVIGLVPLTTWLVVSTLAGDSEETPSFYGVGLGLTASDLRDKLAPTVPGAFRVSADSADNGDLALEWTPLHPGASAPEHARFEIHAGLLVAIRATLPPTSPLAAGPTFSETSVAVLSRRQNPDHTVSLTILARDCPTHAAEVQALLDDRSR